MLNVDLMKSLLKKDYTIEFSLDTWNTPHIYNLAIKTGNLKLRDAERVINDVSEWNFKGFSVEGDQVVMEFWREANDE